MVLSYDAITIAFLSKINEFDFINMDENTAMEIANGYMHRAVAEFRKNCKYELYKNMDDELRIINVDVKDEDVDELVNIISEGMVVQWMKPYINKQEILELTLNTRDFTSYSPAELLYRIRNAYSDTTRAYIQMIREYSYNHADLSELHL